VIDLEGSGTTVGCPVARPWWEADPNLAYCTVNGCNGRSEGFMFDAETECCPWCGDEAWETPMDRRARSGVSR
jgi:hypothetical protein